MGPAPRICTEYRAALTWMRTDFWLRVLGLCTCTRPREASPQYFLFWSHVLHLNVLWSNPEKALLGSASSQVLHQGSPKACCYRDVLFYDEFFLHLGQYSSVILLCVVQNLWASRQDWRYDWIHRQNSSQSASQSLAIRELEALGCCPTMKNTAICPLTGPVLPHRIFFWNV